MRRTLRRALPGRPYDAEVAYTDAALGPLFDAVNDDRTAIIVIGDHGEGLGDHGESTHTLFVYDSTMKVPLLVKAPGVPAGLRVETQVRSVDVAPTILELAGVSPKSTIDGVSLLGRLGVEGTRGAFRLRRDLWHVLPVQLERAPVPAQGRIQVHRSAAARALRPPGGSRRNQESLDGEPVRCGKEASPRARLGSRKRRNELPPNAVDEETKRRLESLGYVASSQKKNPGGLPDPKDRVEVFDRMQELLSPEVPAERQAQGLREILALEPDNILAQKRIAAVARPRRAIGRGGRRIPEASSHRRVRFERLGEPRLRPSPLESHRGGTDAHRASPDGVPLVSRAPGLEGRSSGKSWTARRGSERVRESHRASTGGSREPLAPRHGGAEGRRQGGCRERFSRVTRPRSRLSRKDASRSPGSSPRRAARRKPSSFWARRGARARRRRLPRPTSRTIATTKRELCSRKH